MQFKYNVRHCQEMGFRKFIVNSPIHKSGLNGISIYASYLIILAQLQYNVFINEHWHALMYNTLNYMFLLF